MTAAGAESVEFKAVGLDGEAVPGGDLLLQFFDLAVFKFDDLAAIAEQALRWEAKLLGRKAA